MKILVPWVHDDTQQRIFYIFLRAFKGLKIVTIVEKYDTGNFIT